MSPRTLYLKLARDWIAEARACELMGLHIMADNCRNIASQYQGRADAYPVKEN